MRDQDAPRAAQRTVDVAQSVLDLTLRYTDPAVIDMRRFEWWTQQLRIHAAADDAAGVLGDVAVLEWIRDRFTDALTAADRDEVDQRLRDLRSATDAGNLPAAADHAARLYARVRAMPSPGGHALTGGRAADTRSTADRSMPERIVQLTPPGSACSLVMGPRRAADQRPGRQLAHPAGDGLAHRRRLLTPVAVS